MTDARSPRLEWIDALRGWAVLGVLVVHAAGVASASGMLRQATMSGQLGVELFYILSAFTIFLSLDARREQGSHGFFIRRIARVGPLFWVAILAHQLLLRAAILPGAPSTPSQLLLGFTFLHALDPAAINTVAIGGWSIAVEFAFYALAPALYGALRTARSAAIALGAAILCCGGVSWWLAAGTSDPAMREYLSFIWPPVQLPVFLFGVLAYRLRPRIAPARAGTCVMAGVLLLALSFPTRNGTLYLAAAALALLLLAVAAAPSRLVVNRVSRFLGRLSYSLYLMHFFCLPAAGYLISGLIRSGVIAGGSVTAVLVAFAATAALAVPLSLVTYRLIERPGIRIGEHLIARAPWRRAALRPAGA